MDKIIISDLLASGIIGVKHPERDQAQNLLINVTLYYDLRNAGMSDSITNTINYSSVSKSILSMVAATKYYTVEALATHIARELFQQFPAESLRLRIEKLKIVAHTSRVGVEIFRRRTDY